MPLEDCRVVAAAGMQIAKHHSSIETLKNIRLPWKWGERRLKPYYTMVLMGVHCF
jgi:hypothetical protein